MRTHFCFAWQISCLWASRVQAIGISDHLRFVDVLNTDHNERSYFQDDTINRDDDVQMLSVEQRLDHFKPSSHKFQQRYFYSNRYVLSSANTQYAFLCCGGEGPSLTKQVLLDSVHCTGDMLELARHLHSERGISVHLFALEHRYYGESYPEFVDDKNQKVSPVTNENLVYLSSRQALEDLAHFVSQMMAQGPTDSQGGNVRGTKVAALPSDTKWVTFGGSYPGMLAGWARLKYPHLIHAAVSNSAPILATLDMHQYFDRVSWDLQYSQVGGSKACLQAVQEGHQQLADMVGTPTGRQTVAKAFNFCDESTLEDIENVRAWLGDGAVSIPSQGNDPACEEDLCNIQKICAHITSEQIQSTPSWQVLADLAHEQGQSECLTVDWNSTLDYLKDPERGQAGGLRSWLWQTCTEFGFYQTCEVESSCPWAKGFHTLDQDFEICDYAFGVPSEEVKASIQQTKDHYGDNKLLLGGSRILSVNGDVDPWATLARDTDTPNSDDPLLPTLMVEGASHHFWTHPVQETDTPFVTKARAFIDMTVTKWLDLDSDEKLVAAS